MTSIADSVHELHHEDYQEELMEFTALLASAIQAGVEEPRVSKAIADTAAQQGLRLTTVAADGRVLQDNQNLASELENYSDRPEIADAFLTGVGESIRLSSTMGTELVYAAVAIPRPAGGTVILRLGQPLSRIVAAEDRITTAIGIALAAAVLITLLTLIVLSHSISRRTDRAAAAARRFSSGDFTVRLPEDGPVEFSGLAHSLNEMAAKLDSNISTLRVRTSEMLAILQSMSNAVIALDRDHRILRLNTASLQMFDLADLDLRGRLLRDTIQEPALLAAADTALSSGIRFSSEIPLTGSTSIAELIAEPMTGSNGEVIGTVLVLEDVTRLRRLERVRTDFAANVSHELRTPVTSIGGYAEILQETDDPDLIKKCSEVIVRNTARLSAIIENLLTLARVEDPHRRSLLELESVSIASVFDSVIHSTENVAKARNITITSRVEGEPRVKGTQPLLEQAIGNLVSNAMKYGDGSVEIRGSNTEHGLVRIEVEDFGSGIAEQHHDRIFERFYRVDRSRSRELGGTGLGLAIVKHIASVLGGTIDVKSRLGVGTTFVVSLPAG
ncbi:MAG: ATP-binding protein [Phycisphaerales bacterium]|nr:ATP-binding protein [Phycisphaerales bacterium]